ncbi:MAG: SIS domain-containing protein [Candidatus Atribacteria bacterium]|nr:SIS domain-containing protein [Candidatus Atribacteria bacterium]
MSDNTYREIMHQPEAWNDTLAYLEKNPLLYEKAVRGSFDSFLFSGCGTSYNLSLSAAALWQKITRTPARGIPASELFLFPDLIGVPGKSYLLFGISRSGETSETIRAVNFFRDHFSGLTVGITCDEGSSLLSQVSVPVLTSSAHEESMVMTQSFTTMLLTLVYFAYFRVQKENYLSELPGIFKTMISEYESSIRQLGEDLSFEKFIFLGNGPYYGVAWEGSLKLKEMTATPTETFHFLEFRHGPKSIVDQKTLIIALTSSAAFSLEKDVIREMHDLGATIFHVGRESLNLTSRCLEIKLKNMTIDDCTAPILDVSFLQFLGYYRARAKKMNPDEPRNLTKVVKI